MGASSARTNGDPRENGAASPSPGIASFTEQTPRERIAGSFRRGPSETKEGIILSGLKRSVALLLAAIVFFSASFTSAAMDGAAARAEIERIYAQAISLYQRNTGSSSFYGNCGVYISYLLNALGIDSYLGGHKGNEWYHAYQDGQKLGEYTVVKIPGANCLRQISEQYQEAHYIVVSYTHQTHYTNANPGAGHVVFINMIKDGVAYFSESYRVYQRDTQSYAAEGAPVVMSAEELAADHEDLYGDAIGALMFVKDGLNIKKGETGPGAEPSQGSQPITQPQNKGLLSYIGQALASQLGFSVDISRSIVRHSDAPTVSGIRASVPDFDITVRGVGGTSLSASEKVGTNMQLIVKYQGADFVFDISIKGDFDGDGRVTSKDARSALLVSARRLPLEELSEMQRGAFDTNRDGKVNSRDARNILMAAAHLITLR